MSPFILAILLFSMGMGTTITFTSDHWLMAWMGLEINALSFLPLMSMRYHPRATEATVKYFLIQTAGAAMLLFAALTNAWITGQWGIQQTIHSLPMTMMTMALALKIGLAPFHMWLPEVLQGLDLTVGLILSTWQKLAPFALLLQIQPVHPTILAALGVLSIIVGGWGGLNHTQVRKILAYSSIAHLGWMVLVLPLDPSLTLLALLTYLTLTTSTFLIFKLNSATTINMLAITPSKTPAMMALIPLVLLSLGGLPPLTGFMPKWLMLQEMSKNGMAPAATSAALFSLLSLYYYLRLTYTMTLTMSPNNLIGTASWRFICTQITMPLAIVTTASILLLPITPTLWTLCWWL
uniref:NADH-ubiquinone oxidoreductase chain 2 n=1 Tax=Moolgarda perusii TaxID=1111165 RepID=A0A7L9R592_9TELE|nr:NADH dehydrogenase subunit 2 [Moolgarda perusii]QOL10554.1 NADH dehydrogenase subunit 2 [Moolgarda perusii]